MTSPASDRATVPLDADGRVCVDAPCVGCGYNLRTLAANGICTECGRPVHLSTNPRFLRFADADWLRRIARGTLLLVVAIGLLIGGSVLLPAIMAAFAFRARAAPPTPGTMIVFSLVQYAFGAALMVLATYGLWCVAKRDPAAAYQAEGLTARRVLRICAGLLPASLLLSLFTMRYWIPVVAGMAAPLPFPVFTPTLIVLVVLSGITTLAAFVTTPLALLRYLTALMQRVPRPGLARFCRIEFWGGLLSGATVIVGYGWMFIFFLLPMMTAPPTMMPMPATAPFTPTSGRAVSVTNVSAWRGTTYTYIGPSGQVVTSWPTTTPTGSMPTTMVAVPTPPPMGATFAVAGCLTGVGGCVTLGFGVAGFVLLILVQRTLAQAARAAAENAAIGSPVTAAPAQEP